MSPGHQSEWIEVGTLEQIPRLGSRVIKSAQGEIALFRTADDQVFALLNRCPHKQGPLADGLVHGHRITCPLHNWKLELESGEVVPPDVGCTPRFPVRIEQQRILLRV